LKQYHQSPEDDIITAENMDELVQKATDSWDRINRVFFVDDELNIWVDRHKRMSIRALAMKYHRSRHMIRGHLRQAENKLILLRKFFSL